MKFDIDWPYEDWCKSVHAIQGIAGKDFDKEQILNLIRYGSEKDRRLYEWVRNLQQGVAIVDDHVCETDKSDAKSLDEVENIVNYTLLEKKPKTKQNCSLMMILIMLF